MLKKIKTLLALLLLVCLFLPLAKCTSEANQLTDKREMVYQVIDVQNLQLSWPMLIPIVIFALPLLLLLSRWFLLNWRLRYFFVDSAANILVLGLLWFYQLFSQWLVGAWLAFSLCLAMLLISLFQIVAGIKRNRRLAQKT